MCLEPMKPTACYVGHSENISGMKLVGSHELMVRRTCILKDSVSWIYGLSGNDFVIVKCHYKMFPIRISALHGLTEPKIICDRQKSDFNLNSSGAVTSVATLLKLLG